jgi:hypothetical protein
MARDYKGLVKDFVREPSVYRLTSVIYAVTTLLATNDEVRRNTSIIGLVEVSCEDTHNVQHNSRHSMCKTCKRCIKKKCGAIK